MKMQIYRQIGGLFHSKWKAFWVFASAILLIAALFKSHWLILDWENASVEDPVVAPMMVNHVGLAGVLLELAIIVSLFLLRNDLARAVSLLWFAIILSLYRAWFPESDDGYCPCFGTLPEILGLSPGFASFIARTSVHIFIAGSLLIIFLELKLKVKLSPSQKSSTGKLRRPTAFLWLCLLLAGGGQDLAAQGPDLELLSKPPYPIEVQGRVERLTPSDDNPNVMETEEGIFSAIINKGRMSAVIKILRNPWNTDIRILDYEYRTDGNHSISFGKYDTNIVWPDDYIIPKKINGEWKQITNSTPWKPSSSGSARLSPTPIPYANVSQAIPMVLGFNWSLLESFYQNGKGPKILDFGQKMRGKLLKLTSNHRIDTNSMFNGLSYLSTSTRRGWTNDLFSVSGRFDSDLGTCPQKLVYSSFLSSYQAKDLGITNRTELRVELTITNVIRSEIFPLAMLDFPEIVTVHDRRFSLRKSGWIPSMIYVSTNGSIPTMERVMQQDFYADAVAQHAASARGSLLRRILLGFLLLAGPLLVWRFLWKRKNRSMKERLFQWVLLAGLLASSGQDLAAQGPDLELLSKLLSGG